jgi:predicted metal-dependent phosphoesterase TrpH
LHAHATASDGEAPPSALAARYARAGYDVLATTDHWNVTAIESDEILVIPSSELNASLPNGRDGHVLTFGIDRLPERREPFPSLAAAAEWIDGSGGVAYLAHPRWTGAGATITGTDASVIHVDRTGGTRARRAYPNWWPARVKRCERRPTLLGSAGQAV